MADGICEDCGVRATIFKDLNDGGSYCLDCWTQFYGSPPVTNSSGAKQKDTQSHLKDLPEDAPRGHPAHSAVKYQAAKKVFSFQWLGSGGSRIPFQTTVPAAANSRWAAEVIARACYMKFEQGWTKDKILEWRNQCYARLGGRAPSMLTSQAASQRVRRSEAPERSRSRQAERKTSMASIPLRSPKSVTRERKDMAKSSRSSGDAFLPPNHLKLLLDDPQAPLPKSEIIIRSQGFAFSQSQGFGFDPKNSQDERSERRQDRLSQLSQDARTPAKPIFRSCEVEGTKGAVEQGRGHCCCCRARKDSEPQKDLQKNLTPGVGPTERGVLGHASKDVKGESDDVKRKRSEEETELMLKRLKEEPPESQHRPESQPTPFIYEPPVLERQPVPDTFPTPLIEVPIPPPESQPLPMPNAVYETIVTPWCTQPTPKVDAADCVFISDPTPIPPAKEDDDAAAAPELTQPTPVPPAPKGADVQNATQVEQESLFADTAVDKGEAEVSAAAAPPPAAAPAAAAPPDTAFPTVSLDVVPDVDQTGPSSVVPPKVTPSQLPQLVHKVAAASPKLNLNFAALLLQRSRAATANRQQQLASKPADDLKKVDFAVPTKPAMSELKAFVSQENEHFEQAPESTHPPVQAAPEDAHPPGFGARATI